MLSIGVNGAINAERTYCTVRVLALLFLILLLFVTCCGCSGTEQIPEPVESAIPEVSSAPVTESPEETPDLVIFVPTPEPAARPEKVNETFVVSFEGTKYRSRPAAEEDKVLGTLSIGTRVVCVEDRGEYLLVELEDGKQVWINEWYLTALDDSLADELSDSSLQSCIRSESFQTIDGEPVYECTANLLNCRAKPDLTANILCQIVPGTRLIVYGKDNGFFLCRLPNGKLCYCAEEWVTDIITYAEYPWAVDLRVFLPEAQFDLRFASSNNLTGKAMYPAIPLLERGTAEMLYKAYQAFLEDGYVIKIYDAYRPLSAQIKLFNIVQDMRFVADPSAGYSWHQRGRAIDMSLVDLSTGKELVMPTPIHTLTMESARTQSSKWSEEARSNVDYMTRVMRGAGFGTIATEWWHFEYTGQGRILDPDINLYSLPKRPVSEYESNS